MLLLLLLLRVDCDSAKESPELEQKKNALVVQNARMKKQLQDTEDGILKLLTSSQGDILGQTSHSPLHARVWVQWPQLE